jgi:hypothetical protein
MFAAHDVSRRAGRRIPGTRRLAARCIAALAVLAALTTIACGHHSASAAGRVRAKDPPIVAPAFPLQVAAGGRYLVDAAGRPFLLQGDAGWSLIAGLTDAEADIYLEDRRRRGFNTILVNLLEHKFAPHAPRNAYGEPPFASPGDFAAPNEAYFAHADVILRRAKEKGLAVLLAPAYLGQNGGDEGFYQEIVSAGPVKLRAYGAFVGARYGALDNVIWVLGGDYTPPAEAMTSVAAMAEGIRGADGGHHLFTAHWSAETSSEDAGMTPLDLNATYTYLPVYEKSLADHLRPHARPHFLIESAYELEHDSRPQRLRGQAYYALLTGAAGQVFGNGAIWGFFRAWPANLGTEGCLSMTNLYAFFEPLAWYSLEPDAHNEVLVDGSGRAPGKAPDNDYALLARSADGTLAVAYLPVVREVKIDLGKLKTPLRARWYDPTTGSYAEATGSPFTSATNVSFDPPASNGAGDSDWVLLLETAPSLDSRHR